MDSKICVVHKQEEFKGTELLELDYIFILIFESDLVNKVETMVGSNLLLS